MTIIDPVQKLRALERLLDSSLREFREAYDGQPFPPSTKNVDFLDGQTDALALALACLRESSAPEELRAAGERLAARVAS
ncbi:Uncharacterised protein [Mycolicibacterium vanbaalenii]|uniref:Uncharacterized protein n=1 Tax=Mycolicibacterium vanbaalenii TaxID=110539 RepID=A0A5S9R6Z6_MYCVN|nr:hypothetical protein [Mycolicibacterium vanbaalenii]CAA0129268.1 Uncharacterised protein [Mycolicibacterium vanbaalenii]